MQVLQQRELAPTPGEQYLKALWRGRWLFLAIVAAFVGDIFVERHLALEQCRSRGASDARDGQGRLREFDDPTAEFRILGIDG